MQQSNGLKWSVFICWMTVAIINCIQGHTLQGYTWERDSNTTTIDVEMIPDDLIFISTE